MLDNPFLPLYYGLVFVSWKFLSSEENGHILKNHNKLWKYLIQCSLVSFRQRLIYHLFLYNNSILLLMYYPSMFMSIDFSLGVYNLLTWSLVYLGLKMIDLNHTSYKRLKASSTFRTSTVQLLSEIITWESSVYKTNFLGLENVCVKWEKRPHRFCKKQRIPRLRQILQPSLRLRCPIPN